MSIEFSSITVKELFDEANSAFSENEMFGEINSEVPGNPRVFGGCSYGDRQQTWQAMPITGVSVVSIDTTGYSASGFKVASGETDFEKVVLLNEDMSCDIDDAFLLSEMLIELEKLIESGKGDLKVAYCSDYGDHINTAQIHGVFVESIGEAQMSESAYSDSGWAIITDHEEDHDDKDLMSVYTLG
ncbi:hypothetical protein [Vibrio vulnificus]|uniref:hypothetical protein n=1 Tax=Vibrio vulnificus TaxID=672 RepID=UPI0032422018|nr:hypothetical protein [Vibrio parahaemolyticus]